MRKLPFCLALVAFAVMANGCSYLMFYKVSNYEYDDTKADREMEALDRDRAERMRANKSYGDVEMKAVNERSTLGGNTANSKPLSVEELRAQQEKERRERSRRR